RASQKNLQEAWTALAMVRETVETLAPSGSVKAREHLEGPTFMHEADALVEGVRQLAAQVERLTRALQPLKQAMTGVPQDAYHNAHPFVYVPNDLKAKGTMTTITWGQMREVMAALTSTERNDG